MTFEKIKQFLDQDTRIFVKIRVTNLGYHSGEVVGVGEDKTLIIEAWGEYHNWPYSDNLKFTIEPSGNYNERP